jgi:hypothetical protein
MGRQPRFYSVTIISDGQPRSAAHTDRQIRLKAHGQLKNGSGRAGEHPIPILAVEKVDLDLARGFESSPSEANRTFQNPAWARP